LLGNANQYQVATAQSHSWYVGTTSMLTLDGTNLTVKSGDTAARLGVGGSATTGGLFVSSYAVNTAGEATNIRCQSGLSFTKIELNNTAGRLWELRSSNSSNLNAFSLVDRTSNSQFLLCYNNGTNQIQRAGGGTTFDVPSDERIKEDIVPFSKGLAEINQLKPQEFWYQEGLSECDHLPTKCNAKYKSVGLLAQDVRKVLPEMITYTQTQKYEDLHGINFSNLPFLTINAIKELTTRLSIVEGQLVALQQKVSPTKPVSGPSLK
jgi:hypothetical protein